MQQERPNQTRLTIRKKMLLFCIMLLVLPSVIVGFYSYDVAKDSTDELIQKNLENSVKLMSQTIIASIDLVNRGELSLEHAQENLKVLMLGNKQPDGTRPINRLIDLGPNGYYYVINSEGVLIAHPDQEGENLWDSKTSDGFYYIQDVIHQGLNGGGFTYYDWALPNSDKEALKITYALAIPEWDWILVAGSYYQDYNTGQRQILQSTIIVLICCIIIGIIGVLIFSNHIARPITAIASDTLKVSSGDLTTGDVTVRNKDELGLLADHFNRMKEQLRALVEQVSASSADVQQASHNLQTSIGETTQASRMIAESTQQIASGIDIQANSTKQSAQAMEEMALGIQRIADTSSTAYEASIQSEEEAKQGHTLIHQSIAQMHSLQQVMEQIVAMMHALDKRSHEISKIVTVMTDIASQTSLLSLNASIEAARAGEEGKGFAVVALEVKKLAEMSRASSEQIKKMVQSVQADIASASQSTMLSISEFQQGVLTIEQMGEVFERIVTSAHSVVGQIQEVSATAEELSAGSEEIFASIQELNHVAERSAQSSEHISAATEEQITTMEQIYRSAHSLHDMAVHLRTMISQFKV